MYLRWFSNSVGFEEIECLHVNHILHQWVDINSIFLFDIKYKKLNLMQKTFEFFIFPLEITPSWWCHPVPFRIFMDDITILSSSPMQHLRWSFLWQKNRKQLKTVVDCCYRELHLKCDRACRSNSETHR